MQGVGPTCMCSMPAAFGSLVAGTISSGLYVLVDGRK